MHTAWGRRLREIGLIGVLVLGAAAGTGTLVSPFAGMSDGPLQATDQVGPRLQGSPERADERGLCRASGACQLEVRIAARAR